MGAEVAKQNDQRNDRKWIPQGTKNVKKLGKIDPGRVRETSWRGPGRALGGRAGRKAEKPAPAYPDFACFGAIFGHFGIILVFFSEAVFQHGLGTVFS